MKTSKGYLELRWFKLLSISRNTNVSYRRPFEPWEEGYFGGHLCFNNGLWKYKLNIVYLFTKARFWLRVFDMSDHCAQQLPPQIGWPDQVLFFNDFKLILLKYLLIRITDFKLNLWRFTSKVKCLKKAPLNRAPKGNWKLIELARLMFSVKEC